MRSDDPRIKTIEISSAIDMEGPGVLTRFDKPVKQSDIEPDGVYEYQLGVQPEEPPKENEIELMESKALVRIPENTIQLDLNATVWHDGKAIAVHKTLDMKQVRQAFEDGEDYIDDEDTFVITDKGREFLEEMNKR